MPSLLFELSEWWNSPYINHFISADTVVLEQNNPQDINRYSYVNNNPLRYTDPSGHMRVEEAGGSHGSVNCSKYPQYCKNGKLKSPEELAKMRNKPKTCAVATMATVLDTVAAGVNGSYAIVGDIVGLVCEVCYPAVVGLYQPFSAIPNSISTLSMLRWIGDGVDTGENSFTFSQTSQGTSMSLSVSQDTIIAVSTNIAGWTVLREPNAAFGVDAAVAGYDYGRLGATPFKNINIPAWINPTVTYNSNTGFGFSW